MIVWNSGKGSQIHDHANAHCIMRVLKGSLVETVYNWPESSDTQGVPLSVKKQTKYQEKEVAYISDQIGLHRISNPNTEDVAVSLHCKSHNYLDASIRNYMLIYRQCTRPLMQRTTASTYTTRRPGKPLIYHRQAAK